MLDKRSDHSSHLPPSIPENESLEGFNNTEEIPGEDEPPGTLPF